MSSFAPFRHAAKHGTYVLPSRGLGFLLPDARDDFKLYTVHLTAVLDFGNERSRVLALGIWAVQLTGVVYKSGIASSLTSFRITKGNEWFNVIASQSYQYLAQGNFGVLDGVMYIKIESGYHLDRIIVIK